MEMNEQNNARKGKPYLHDIATGNSSWIRNSQTRKGCCMKNAQRWWKETNLMPGLHSRPNYTSQKRWQSNSYLQVIEWEKIVQRAEMVRFHPRSQLTPLETANQHNRQKRGKGKRCQKTGLSMDESKREEATIKKKKRNTQRCSLLRKGNATFPKCPSFLPFVRLPEKRERGKGEMPREEGAKGQWAESGDTDRSLQRRQAHKNCVRKQMPHRRKA